MGVYLDPPDILKEIGRPLSAESYSALVDQLRSDELLFGLYDRIIFKNAAQLNSTNEMEAMSRQVHSGSILHEGFFAVKISDAEKYTEDSLEKQTK